MKLRIVETASHKFKIQRRVLFLWWRDTYDSWFTTNRYWDNGPASGVYDKNEFATKQEALDFIETVEKNTKHFNESQKQEKLDKRIINKWNLTIIL